MGRRVDNQFERLLNNYPNIRYVVMEKCLGSRNDDELFKAARMLHDQSVNVPSPKCQNRIWRC